MIVSAELARIVLYVDVDEEWMIGAVYAEDPQSVMYNEVAPQDIYDLLSSDQISCIEEQLREIKDDREFEDYYRDDPRYRDVI